MTLSGQSDACETTVKFRLSVSVLSLGWESLLDEFLAEAVLALLVPATGELPREISGGDESLLLESMRARCV
jgi:hypothetical protein